MNVERLKSDRGVHTVENYFKDIKFMGKGQEKQDLNNMMKRLEHWAHRLYPNYNFDDFIGTTEKLGKKKQIQTHMYRYRQGVLEPVEKPMNELELEENEDVDRGLISGIEPIDELDEIIDQQIQNYTVAPPKTPGHNATFDSIRHETTFDSVRSSVIATPNFMARNPIESSTPLFDRFDPDIRPLEQTPTNKPASTPSLTSEQMAKIAENRRLAQERLKAKSEALLKQQQQQQKELTQIDEETFE